MEEGETDLRVARARLMRLGREELQAVATALVRCGFETSPLFTSLFHMFPPPGYTIQSFQATYPCEVFGSTKMKKELLLNKMLDFLGFGQQRTPNETMENLGAKIVETFRGKPIPEAESSDEEY